MAEKFEKMNDYTLLVSSDLSRVAGYLHGGRVLTNIFNFQTRQKTTIYDHVISYNTQMSVASQMQIENFKDIECKDEVIAMHEKLRELGGNPPDMPDILTKRNLLPLPKDKSI